MLGILKGKYFAEKYSGNLEALGDRAGARKDMVPCPDKQSTEAIDQRPRTLGRRGGWGVCEHVSASASMKLKGKEFFRKRGRLR